MYMIDEWDSALGQQVTRPATSEEAAEIDARKAAASIPIVPQSVTMRQARLALLGAGKLSAVDAAIAGLSSPQKEAAQIEWDYSSVVERNRPFVQLLAPALGLSDTDVDQLFITAATL